jgi:hypothetical protein
MDSSAGDGYISAEEWTAGIHLLFPQYGGLIGGAVTTAILEQGIQDGEYDTRAISATNLFEAGHAIVAAAHNIPNLDLQAQLAVLQQQRTDLAAVVQGDQGALKELLSESKYANPTILANMQARIAADQAKLKQVHDQIAALRGQVGKGVVQNDSQPFPVYG